MEREQGTKQAVLKRRRLAFTLSTIAGAALILGFVIQAQTAVQTSTASFETIGLVQPLLDDAKETIAGWEKRATVCLVLGICIGGA